MSAILLISCVRDNGNRADALVPGDKLPEFQVTMNDGTLVNVPQDLKGSVSCIVFFNTGCKDCREELPVIQRLNDELPDIKFLLVSRAEEEASVASWWAGNGMSMPFSPQPDRTIYELFAASVIPRIYISDNNARIVAAFSDNPLPTYESLKSVLISYSAGTKASPSFFDHR
ncbi:MAG: TlpA family protein disulfide reductase [Candidatus Cryptobacteroides sp.]